MKNGVAESTDKDVQARQVVGAALVGQVVAAQHVLPTSYHFRYSICNINKIYFKPVQYREHKRFCNISSVVNPDPIGSASFRRIHIEICIQGLPIRIRIFVYFNPM
jgi:hypothetical protein